MWASTQERGCRHSRAHHKRKSIIGLLRQALCILAVLVLFHVAIVSADAPPAAATTTLVVTSTQVVTPTPEATTTLQATTAPISLAQAATPTPTPITPTPVTPTPTPITPTPTPITPTPVTPTPTPTPPLPGTAHLAIRVSEAVVSVGGTASSEVFVSLMDVQAGIVEFYFSLRFDPDIVRIVDADGNAANGTQVTPAVFLEGQEAGPPQIVKNHVDNGTGEITLAVIYPNSAPVHTTASWRKAATLTWVGQKEGNSVVSVGSASGFVAPDGRQFAPDAAHNGAVFVRSPGQVLGLVRLQGRAESSGAQVTSSLATARVDAVSVARDGRFDLATSHGEGFYTLTAFAPGYLSAESHRPVKLTVGSVIDLGEVTLYGGDVTGDNRIDVRDLSYVAWHLNADDAKADINGDGQVDILDLSLIAGNFGRVGPTVWQIPDTR